MKRRYFTLLTRESKSEQWGIQFGDYSRCLVVDEARAQRDSFAPKKLFTKIIETYDSQREIDSVVADMNLELRTYGPDLCD
jgi:hypothetical protein